MKTEYELTQGEYRISTRHDEFDIAAIHAFLRTSYWSPNIPLEIVRRAIANSLCFGLFHGKLQIGFARVVSDHATFAYLCDVYVLDGQRGQGLGKWMMTAIMQHPDLQHLRRFMLATRDAHTLYAQYGFLPLANPSRLMEIVDPDIYTRMNGSAT
jgi:GNAT superfamily N-acetyltransferase